MMMMKYRNYLFAGNRGIGTANLYLRLLEGLQLQHPNLLVVTTEDLLEYLSARRATHKANSRKSMRTAFRSFYAWAFMTGRMPADIAYHLPPIRVPLTAARVAGDDVVQMGLLTAGTEVTAMIMLARFACLRLSELTTLRTNNREGDLLRIVGKGEKERMVPINDDLMNALLTLERDQGAGFYFPGRWGGSMHPQSVNKIITRHLGTNPHSLRHAGATAAYLATKDIVAVQEFLGHASIATTRRYLHIELDAVRKVAAATAFTNKFTQFPTTTLSPNGSSSLHDIAA